MKNGFTLLEIALVMDLKRRKNEWMIICSNTIVEFEAICTYIQGRNWCFNFGWLLYDIISISVFHDKILLKLTINKVYVICTDNHAIVSTIWD